MELGTMKPTDFEIKQQAIANNGDYRIEDQVGFTISYDDFMWHKRNQFLKGAQWAISQTQPEWVTVNSPADLPKDNKGYWVENHKGEVQPRDGFTMFERNTRRYTPVVKPQPPKENNQ